VAIVGGSDLKKIEEQLTPEGIQSFNPSARLCRLHLL
jgi:hypothetical protein